MCYGIVTGLQRYRFRSHKPLNFTNVNKQFITSISTVDHRVDCDASLNTVANKELWNCPCRPSIATLNNRTRKCNSHPYLSGCHIRPLVAVDCAFMIDLFLQQSICIYQILIVPCCAQCIAWWIYVRKRLLKTINHFIFCLEFKCNGMQ